MPFTASSKWLGFVVLVLLSFALACPAMASPKKENSGLKLVDNDVYLFTPELWQRIQEFAAGDVTGAEAKLAKHIKEHPNIFSAHFMLGLYKVRNLLLAPDDHRQKKEILRLFNECLKQAKRAQKVKKFHDAGLFYEMLSEASLSLYYGLMQKYFKAHTHASAGMRTLDKLLKRRPQLHGATLLKGIYNYYTGRFGFITKLILRLIGLPPGDTNLGAKQIRYAAGSPNPIWWFANVYAIYVFAPKSALRNEALSKANDMIRLFPKNYYSYLLRGFVYIKKADYKRALADNRKGRSLIVADPTKLDDSGIIADAFLLDVRGNYLNVLLYRNEKSLVFLNTWAKKKSPRYAEAPLIALMYLGHLHSFAGMEKEAKRLYARMQNFEQLHWMRDLGKRYEKKPIGRRYRFPKKRAKQLNVWLKTHPEVRSF